MCYRWALILRRFVNRSHGRLARTWLQYLAAGSCGVSLKPPAVLRQRHIVSELSTYYAHHGVHNRPTSAVPCMNPSIKYESYLSTKNRVTLTTAAPEIAQLHFNFALCCRKTAVHISVVPVQASRSFRSSTFGEVVPQAHIYK
uniref:Uncharacterized protein n=1 Tax=Arundo donax TaxID=35708 RepID=A0A0A9DS51_ARUDO